MSELHVSESAPRLRVFVASAAAVLTDHALHGEGLVAWQTLAGLAERGHELVVCAPNVDLSTPPPFEVVATGQTLRWESLEPIAYAWRTRQIFERYGGSARFDAIHWLRPHEPLVFVPPKGVRFVVGPRTASWPHQREGARAVRRGDMVRKAAYPVFHMLRRKALARTTRILVSTPSAIAELPKRYRPNVEIQPPGVDETRFSVHPFPTTPTVIYVGRLEPVKRVSELIEAFGILAPELPEARLLLVGDGPERSFLESRCVELGIANAVTLTGNVPHSEIPAFLARSTVLCLPSHGEPLGMVVLEAMATGRPVVAVANGGPAWLIKQDIGGVLAPSGTAGELAAGLLRVLRDRQLAEAMGGYNRTRVASEFGLARLVQVLERAYAGA